MISLDSDRKKKQTPVSQTVKPSDITDRSQPHWSRTVVKPDLQVTVFFSKRKRDTATWVSYLHGSAIGTTAVLMAWKEVERWRRKILGM